MAHHLTHGGSRAVAQTTALLTTTQGAGAVAGALCLAPLATSLGRGRVLAWSLVLLPATLIAYSTAATRWWGAAALFAVSGGLRRRRGRKAVAGQPTGGKPLAGSDGAGGKPGKALTAGKGTGKPPAAAGDDLGDVAEILRRRGIR